MVDTVKKKLYNFEETRRILGMGKTLMYQIIRRDDFPKLRINGRYFVPCDKLEIWITKQMKN